jgi:phage terminase large subunit
VPVATRDIPIEIPEKLAFLLAPARYKVAYGGRYGVKSWTFARVLLMLGLDPELLWPGRSAGPRILCARETQKSIQESVHHLLKSQIERMGIQSKYDVREHSIRARNGAEFIFAGIKQNVDNLKSYEDCDICWVEEANKVSKNSWRVLIPTIRKEGSEIWITFNPELESDNTYERFVTDPPASAIVVRTTYKDNPWLSKVILDEIRELKAKDEEEYDHIYGGLCKQSVDGAIYAKQLSAADKEGRITRVPYDPKFPVHTFWDLGWGDNTSIWFGQSLPSEFRMIDYMDGSLLGLQYYVKQLKERPYVYGTHWLPHDAKAHELGSGRTIEEQLRDHFESVRVAKMLSVEDGIEACRLIFNRCWFDKEKTADGVQSLRHYRYQRDENLKTFKREPLHDWASHGADAFRTMGVSIKELQRPKKEDDDKPTGRSISRPSGGAWME